MQTLGKKTWKIVEFLAKLMENKKINHFSLDEGTLQVRDAPHTRSCHRDRVQLG